MVKDKKQYKKQLFWIMGVFILTIVLGTTSYALFNYSRVRTVANLITTGGVSFNATESGIMTLSNVIPITSEEAQNDTTNAKTMTVTIVGDTDLAGGIEYLITASDVDLANANGKILPVKVEASVTGNGLGTEETGDYYTAHTNYGTENKYKILATGDILAGSRILAGYIAPNSVANGVNGTINIKAYVDADSILISDTYGAGTPMSAGEGKTVFTTSEWRSLQSIVVGSTGLSFKIKVEANEGIWVTPQTVQQSTLTLLNNSINLTYGANGEMTYIYNGDGTALCTSSNPDYVTCSIDPVNKKIIVTPVAATTDQVELYISVPGTANYLPPSSTTLVVPAIAKGTINVVANDATRIYGIANPVFTYTSSGAKTGETPAFSGSLTTSAVNNSNIGTYSITQGSLALANNGAFLADNYTISYTGATLTINKAEASLICEDRTYTGSAQNLYSGEGCSSVTNGSKTDAGGPWTLTCTPDSNHYETDTCEASMNKAAGYVTLSASSGTVACKKTKTFTVSSHHGGELSCSSSNTSKATCKVSGTTVTVTWKAAGSANITVTSAATDNYNAATSSNYKATLSSCESTTTCGYYKNAGTHSQCVQYCNASVWCTGTNTAGGECRTDGGTEAIHCYCCTYDN